MKVQIQRSNRNEFNGVDISSNQKSKVIKNMFDNEKDTNLFLNSNSKTYNPEVFFAVSKQSKDTRKENASSLISDMNNYQENIPYVAKKPSQFISSSVKKDIKGGYKDYRHGQDQSDDKPTGVIGFITNFLGFGFGNSDPKPKARSTVKIPSHPINRHQGNTDHRKPSTNTSSTDTKPNSNIADIKKETSKKSSSNQLTKSTENLFNTTASSKMYKLKKSTISSSISINPFKSNTDKGQAKYNIKSHKPYFANHNIQSDHQNGVNQSPDPKNSSMKSKSSNDCVLFIPCMNCGNMIHLEEIEQHSNHCVEVKKDIVVAETSKYTYNTIDYKLRKLHDHVNNIRNLNNQMKLKSEFSREMHHFHTLSQLLADSISLAQINNSTLTELKKLLLSLDVI